MHIHKQHIFIHIYVVRLNSCSGGVSHGGVDVDHDVCAIFGILIVRSCWRRVDSRRYQINVGFSIYNTTHSHMLLSNGKRPSVFLVANLKYQLVYIYTMMMVMNDFSKIRANIPICAYFKYYSN